MLSFCARISPLLLKNKIFFFVMIMNQGWNEGIESKFEPSFKKHSNVTKLLKPCGYPLIIIINNYCNGYFLKLFNLFKELF